MLPESSVRQLKKLRAETKGTDIGDLTTNDRLNKAVPNLQAIGNPVDNSSSIESWEEFSKKDSKLQTIAFKSKLVNKSIKENNNNDNKGKKCKKCKKGKYSETTQLDDLKGVLHCNKCNDEIDRYSIKENNNKNMKNKENVLTLEEFYNVEELDSDIEEDDLIKYSDPKDNWEDRDVEPGYYEEYDDDEDEDGFNRYDADEDDEYEEEAEQDEFDNLEENVKTFEAFSVKAAPKEEKQPEYTILGEEKEPKSNPNFGIGAVKAQEIKKITDFNLIDPPTPKERQIGGSAGQYIDNDKVKGFINRIDGKDVYVESVDEPMTIKKFNIKDVVKNKKSE